MNTFKYEGYNKTINLNSKEVILLADNNLFDYDINLQTSENISGRGSFLNNVMYKEKTYKFQLFIKSVETVKELEEVFDTDRSIGHFGKLYINDFYISCYVTKFSVKNPKEFVEGFILSIEARCLNPFWTKEEKYEFIKFDGTENVTDDGFSFPFSFPFSFKQSRNNRTIINRNPQLSAVDFIFYGPLTKVDIVIGLHRYNVNAELLDNERLVISQRNKTIEKITVAGDRINMMNYRNKEESVFEPIMPGEHIVSFNGDYSFEIIVFDERSVAFWN